MNHFRIFLHFGIIADVIAHDYIADGLQLKFLRKQNEKNTLVVAEFMRNNVMGIMVVEDDANTRT